MPPPRKPKPSNTTRHVPRQARAAATLGFLLEAAKRVVAKEGVQQATVDEIARVAGVSVGTAYRYFPTKEALFRQMVHVLWERELEELRAAMNERAKEPLEAILAAAVHVTVARVLDNAHFYAHWQSVEMRFGSRTLARRVHADTASMFEEILSRRGDEIPLQVDIPFTSDFFAKSVALMVRRAAAERLEELESGRFERELTRVLLRYLGLPEVAC